MSGSSRSSTARVARGFATPRLRRFVSVTRGVACALAGLLAAPPLSAQSALRAGTSIVVAPTWQTWSFGDGVALDSLQVRGARQLSVPFAIQLPLMARTSVSLTGAAYSSALDASAAGVEQERSLSGVTDLRVRVSTRLPGDLFQITGGVNLPTGAVGLSGAENQVLQVLAAPALDAQVSVPGIGLGGTLAVVFAREVGPWAWALGASAERRGRYSPVDATIAGQPTRTELEPGVAMHFSAGADGLFNGNRLSIGVVTDLYGTDRLQLVSRSASSSAVSETYQLGPTITATARAQLANAVLRDVTVRTTARYRSPFTIAGAGEVDGSSGSAIEFGVSGLTGSAGRPSALLGVDLRTQTRLAINDSFIGAGLTAIGATLGASIPVGSMDWRPAVRVSAGTLTTAGASRKVMGLSVGVTAYAR